MTFSDPFSYWPRPFPLYITVAPVVRGYGGWAVPFTEPAGESSLGTLRAGATGRASSRDGVRPHSSAPHGRAFKKKGSRAEADRPKDHCDAL